MKLTDSLLLSLTALLKQNSQPTILDKAIIYCDGMPQKTKDLLKVLITDNFNKDFCEEQVKVLYDGCRSSAVGSILVAAGIYFTNMAAMASNEIASNWILPVTIISILRILDTSLYSRVDKNSLDQRHYLHRFATGSTLAAISWGLLFWNIFPVIAPEYQALLIVIVTAIASFAATTLSYHLGVIIPFLILILLPIEIRVLMESSHFYTMLSILIPVYFLCQLSNALRINKQYLNTIRLELEYKEKEQAYINLQYAVDQHNIVSITDVRGDIIYANQRMEAISQYSQDELIGENHRIVQSDQHAYAFWTDMFHTLAKGTVWHAEVKNIAKDGTPYWLDSTVVPIINKHGKPYQYISIRTEITQLKELERHTLNDKNDALIRAQVAQILQGQSTLKQRMTDTLSTLGKANGLHIQNKLGIFLLPEGACQLEMYITHGQYTEEFLHKEKCVKLGSCLCGRAAVSGEMIISDDCMTDPLHEHKFEVMKPHGHYIVPLTHSGKILGILFIYTEPYPSREQSRLDTLSFIGDLMGVAIANERVKEELEQAKKNAEDMAQTKSDFLANMSHEIRTPMNGVLGMLDLLNNMPVDTKSKGYIDIAQSSASMLLNVINDILDISKIESGKLHIEAIDFDLRKTVEDTADLLAKQAHQKGLELSVFIPLEIQSILSGDVLRLQQVLNNLINNAIKFTHEGEVIVHISTIKQSDSRIRLRFEIKDTGIGIAAEKQLSLFQAFTQVDTSISREYGGTGLGLTISKSLIKMMGGEIGITSVVDEGSTFWFELPFDIVSHKHEYQFSIEQLRILTIDDNETNCLILKKYVETWGAENVTETIPEIGLYRLREALDAGQPFDIVLLDMQMPAVTGQQVAAEIRKDPAFLELKIILLSSMSLDPDIDIQKHFNLMLNKPIRQSSLYDAIATVQNKALLPHKNTHTHLPELTKLSGKLLFVDDNLVNQHVGREMLSRLDFNFEIVANGEEALDARIKGDFDLILMDCQMPVMDGYESARQIRRYERLTDTDRITIIALTANAMQGDREKCLHAGMDDYLAKPYTANNLLDTLSQWLSSEPVSNDIDSTVIAQPQTGIIDRLKFEETLEMMGENMHLITDAFTETGTSNITDMHTHLEQGDFQALRNTVHALKGSCAALGVQTLFELCKITEENCRRGETRDISKQVNEISILFSLSLTEIERLINEEEVEV